jgi:transposase
VARRKVRCFEDGTIRVEEIDWIRKHLSLRLAKQVYRLTAITTNQEAGWCLGLDDETVYRIDKCILEQLA